MQLDNQLKKVPIGIENFMEFSRDDYYYVDKTGFIAELINNRGKVNLFTRPRRFGKTLTMSMLKYFFEVGTDKTLFDGLEISKYSQLCEQYMGKYPVISVSFKDVGGAKYNSAKAAMTDLVGGEALRFKYLLESDKLEKEEKDAYAQLIQVHTPSIATDEEQGIYSMSPAVLKNSLRTLTQLLNKHHGCQVIVLIDEYDVPLDKAFQAGYYNEMIELVRDMFSKVLKTNDNLMFAVITGCMRISKESIFTGLNNLKVHTIIDRRFNEYFGFTDDEVRALLEYYNLSDKFDTVKGWYDGYEFGGVSIYCPWDVINYCDEAKNYPDVEPQNYWANTSGNGLVRRFIDKADAKTRNEIEQLIAGDTIVKQVSHELTYNELDKTIDNMWNVLFFTGYLTCKKSVGEGNYELVIPNLEIRDLFVKDIREWFKENSHNDTETIEAFCKAFPKGDASQIENQLNKYLWNSISIRDTAVRNNYKENFYHGMLLGILQYESQWLVKSNLESGEGFGDILIETPEGVGVVIELKYAKDNNLKIYAEEALSQIEGKQYEARLYDDGMEKIVKIGIAFYKKKCKVAVGED
jgi:hypothetical protein